MSLCLEYFNRSKKINESVLTFPCSIMCCGQDNASPHVVVITQFNDQYNIDRWKLDEFWHNSTMPIKESKVVSSIYDNLDSIFNNLCILKYKYEDIPVNLNRTNQPMDESIYSSMFDSFLNCKKHNATRDLFLWDAFVKHFHPELASIMSANYWKFENIPIEEEKQFIKIKSYRIWNYWPTWKEEFLKSNDYAAPELIFGNLYKKTFTYRRY